MKKQKTGLGFGSLGVSAVGYVVGLLARLFNAFIVIPVV